MELSNGTIKTDARGVISTHHALTLSTLVEVNMAKQSLPNFIPSQKLPINATDLSGRQFERLFVLSFAGHTTFPSGQKQLAWQCQCSCGTVKIIRGSSLKNGHTRSCGCLSIEFSSKLNLSHKMTGTPEYRVWANMHTRCSNPKATQYKDYGGRGVRVCERWSSFENFYADLGPRPSKKHSLDRKEVNGNYEPGNTQWATQIQQSNNRRSNHLITHNGKTQTLIEWSRETGISYSCLRSRLNTYGWTVSRALETK